MIAQHRRELIASEHLAAMHVLQWRAGVETPVTNALGSAQGQWNSLGLGDTLVFDWPSVRGTIERHALAAN